MSEMTLQNTHKNPKRAKTATLLLFVVLFFMWGLITVMNHSLSEHLTYIFSVDYSLGLLMDLTFYGTYLVVSLPAGKLVDRIGYKKAIYVGWIAATAGCFLFNAAVLSRQYSIEAAYYLFLFALFVLAGGITILQVSANLYIVLYGDNDNAASRLNFVQAFNSVGTFFAPVLAGFIVTSMVDLPTDMLEGIAKDEKIAILAPYVHFPYLFLGTVMALFAFILRSLNIPQIVTKGIEPLNKITSLRRRHVMHFPQLRLGAFAIFAYVGAEVALGTYIQHPPPDVAPYFSDLNSQIYWGLAMVGRFLAAFYLIKMNPNRAVGFSAAMAALLVAVCILTTGEVSVWAVTSVGLFNSLLFPSIFCLGVNGLGKFSEEGSSVLIMFIVGGAVLPFMVKNFSYVNYHVAFIIPVVCYIYIAFYGFKLSRYEKQDVVVNKTEDEPQPA